MSYVPTGDSEGWIRRIFFLPRARDVSFSSASQKFTNTTFGGNLAINPPPQFTPRADPRVGGRDMSGEGMGRAYSQHIDDQAVYLHVRAGVPRYNSLTQFFTGSHAFYDPKAAYMARTGRAPNVGYFLGSVAGFLLTAPIQPVIYVGRAIRYFADGKPASRWYNLKPTMHLYWGAVNNMVNTIAANMGIIPPIFGDGGDYGPEVPDNLRQAMHNFDPLVFQKNGGIDMYAVANKAQRLADAHHEKLREDVESAQDKEAIRDKMLGYLGGPVQYGDVVESGYIPPKDAAARSDLLTPKPGYENHEAYLAAYLGSKEGEVKSPPVESEITVKLGEDEEIKDSVMVDDATISEGWPDKENAPGWFSSVMKSFWATNNDAAEFVTFNVRSGDSVSESFTTQSEESELAQTINGISGGGRSRMHTFAGGNVGENAAFNFMETVVQNISGFATGVLDKVGLSGLAAFNGSAYVDIQKRIGDSSVSFPTMSYKIELRSPYGHPYARFMNEVVPMLMWVALAIPRSTGKQSYQTPWLLEVFCPGRGQARTAAIESLTITRGVNNAAWTGDNAYRGIDIDVTFMDLSSIMSMPLTGNPDLFDDENAFTDYMATLSGLSLSDQIYQWRKFNLNLTRSLALTQNALTGAKVGSWLNETAPARLISGFRRGVLY